MDLESILSSSVINEANLITELQKLLCKISDDNFELTILKINSSVFIQTTERLHQLAHNIFTIMDSSINKTDILFNLVLSLSHSLLQQSLKELIDYFIHNFIIGKNKITKIASLARYKFIRLCCEHNLIEISEVNKEIRYWFEYIPQQIDVHFRLLIWFADYIKLDDVLYKKMTHEISEIIKTSFTDDLRSAYDDFLRMEKQDKNFDELIFLTKNYYPKDSPQYYIKNDMLDEFCLYISNTAFNLKEHVQVSFYDPHQILHRKITLLDFAAFYGSIKIFKYLMAEYKSHNYDIFENKGQKSRLTYYAICGGNFEIIRLIFSERSDSDKSPKYAILYYRNSIYDWLLDNPTSILTSTMHASCRANNVEIFLETLKQGLDVTEIYKGFAPIHYAAINGHTDILQILLTLPYVDVNCRASDNSTPLHLAVLSRNCDAVKLLLNNQNININSTISKSYHTPLHLAARESVEDIVEALLSDKRIQVTAYNFIFFFFFIHNNSFYFCFNKHLFILLLKKGILKLLKCF